MRVGGKKKIVVHQSYLKVLDMNFITINYYLGLTKKHKNEVALKLSISLCLYRALLFSEIKIVLKMATAIKPS